MPFETSPLRLWKSLPRPDREEAAKAFWSHPPEHAGAEAAREIMNLLRVRPQAFHKIPLASRVRALAGLAHPPESVADALVLALHLDSRRQLLVDFLDALGVEHQDGMIDEETEVPAPTLEAVRAAAPPLVARHSADAVRVYWNALWMQDRERWAALETVAAEI